MSNIVYYAARHKSVQEVKSSRSGAAFVAISDYFLKNGGTVYGAGFGENWGVVHKRATTREERDEFRGSKYVMSDIRRAMEQVRQDLKDGKKVCFSGTPCQVAAVKNLVGPEYEEQLFTIDILCHGTASPDMWQSYLQFIRKTSGKEITGVNFRDKTKFSWIDHFESIQLNGKWHPFNIWSYLYTHNLLHRDACLKCRYASRNRTGDITIGDFWGVEKVVPEYNKDGKGCSLIICNTDAGSNVFGLVKGDLDYTEVNAEDCRQPALESPAPANEQKTAFEQCYLEKGFFKAAKKYGNLTFLKQARWQMWLLKKKIFKL